MPVNDEVDDSTHDNLEAALEDYNRESVGTDTTEWVDEAPAPDAERDELAAFELYEDHDGRWRWRLVGHRGVVADSETSYHDRKAAQKAVSSFKEEIENTPVVASEPS